MYTFKSCSKMLQRNLPLDGFEMLCGNVRRISRCHNHIPDLGRRRSCSLLLRSVASFENALDLSAYGTSLHSLLHYILAPFWPNFFPILGNSRWLRFDAQGLLGSIVSQVACCISVPWCGTQSNQFRLATFNFLLHEVLKEPSCQSG